MKRVWTAAVLLALVITGCLYNDRHERYLRAVMNRQRLDTVRAGFARSQAAARLGDAAQMQLSLAELREAVLALR